MPEWTLSRYDLLPFLLRDEVTVLYECGYYDGPMDGMLLWNGKKYWFSMYRDYPPGTWAFNYVGRTFVIIELTEEDYKTEAVKHQLWIECCGNYCYDLSPNHKPTKPLNLYYETYPPDRSHENYVENGKPVAHILM